MPLTASSSVICPQTPCKIATDQSRTDPVAKAEIQELADASVKTARGKSLGLYFLLLLP
jgi:hypothetical protein